ncbi:MAG TPA: M4 family metallopeptidase [Kineosporiaceae bacterium]|jgi:Zn-dependent metalloprotease|nr:M4 family metallopeptidase [Kineosporiaceae bacterium]
MSTYAQTLASPSSCSIVPPYVLEALAQHGTAAQRSIAIRTLSLDHTHRTERVYAGFATGHGAAGRLGPVTPEPNRTVYTASGGSRLPGTLVRAEGQPGGADSGVDRAYDGLGHTFAFYRDVFDRDSIDDRGLPLIASVHVGDHWDNAQWNGTQMLFGDGDGEIFGDFTASLDVIGHELTHGVTQYEAQLVYQGQSGALNESMSDVFGSLVKQFTLGQKADQADWLIGAELMLPGFKGTALRSMLSPGTAYDDPRLGGKDPQPAAMNDYVTTRQDNGGVHLNSGIPNRAFALVATALGGQAWEVAGRIWYGALRDRTVRPNATFAAFARATLRSAKARFAVAEVDAVRAAWRTVGVTVR